MGPKNLTTRLLAACGVMCLMLSVALSPARQMVADGVGPSPVCNNQCTAKGTAPNCSCSGTCNKYDPDPFPGQTYQCVGCGAVVVRVNGIPKSCNCSCVDQFS